MLEVKDGQTIDVPGCEDSYVAARIVAFTEPGGNFFYYIPNNVEVEGTTYKATRIPGRKATKLVVDLNDMVLLSSTEVDNLVGLNYEG